MGADALPSIKLYALILEKAKEEQVKQDGHCAGNQGKVIEFKQLSKSKSPTIPQVQSDDLSFYQSAISRSQGKVREDESSEKVATLLNLNKFFDPI